MQATFKYDGASIDYTPTAAVTAGTPVSQSGYVGIPKTDIAANALGALAVTGVFDIVKVTGALAVGDVIGWDSDGDPVGGVAGTGAATSTLGDADFVLGTVIAAAVEAGAVARTQLNEFPGSKILETFPAIAAIADMAAQTQDSLTDNSTGVDPGDDIIAAITEAATITDNSGGVDPGDDTIAVVTNPDLSAWDGSTYPTAAEATAVGTAFTAAKAAVAQLAAKLNTESLAVDSGADAVAQIAAQLAKIKADVAASDTKIDAILAALRTAGIIAT